MTISSVVVRLHVAAGAEVIQPAAATPNGYRAILRHPQGGVFEYTEP